MRLPRPLLMKVITNQLRPSEVLDEVRALAPVSARKDRCHPWWKVDGEELLDAIARAAAGRYHLSVVNAVSEARRTRGRVVPEKLSGVTVFRVLPVEYAEAVVTNQVIAEAMPTEMVEPTWDDELPTLETFRRLAERRYLHRLLEKHGWNVTQAATEAGVSRSSLHTLLLRHGLRRPATDSKAPSASPSQEAELQEMTA